MLGMNSPVSIYCNRTHWNEGKHIVIQVINKVGQSIPTQRDSKRFILKYMSAKDSVSVKNILTSDKFYKLSGVGNIESYLDILTGRISILADELALFSSQSKLNRKNSITSEELLSPIVCQLSHSFDINPGDFNSYWLNLYQICLSVRKSKRKMK